MKDKQRGRRHRRGKQVDHSMGLNRRNCPTEHLERFMANVMGTRNGLSVVAPPCSSLVGRSQAKIWLHHKSCCSFLGLSGCRLWANSHKFLFEGSRGHLNLVSATSVLTAHQCEFIASLIHLAGFPGGAVLKNPPASARDSGDHGFDPWVRKIPWKRKVNPLQYFYLENFMDRGAWHVIVHGVTKA